MTWQDRRDDLSEHCLVLFKRTTYKGPFNSFQNGFKEGFTAGRKDALDEMKFLVEALKLTIMHYEHPIHDHSWAFFLKEAHADALAKYKALMGEGRL